MTSLTEDLTVNMLQELDLLQKIIIGKIRVPLEILTKDLTQQLNF